MSVNKINRNSIQVKQSPFFPNSVRHENKNDFGIDIIRIRNLSFFNLRLSISNDTNFKRIYGCNLPKKYNSTSSSGKRKIIWLGVDEFLLLFDNHEEEILYENLNITLKDQHFALTNLSDSLTAINLKGPNIREVLSKGCPIDLHETVFRANDCAQTILDRTNILLFCDDIQNIMIICQNSFYDYVSSWLKDASLEFGYNYMD